MDQKRNIEKLLQERHENKQKISSMNFEMIQLQLKNTAASMKVNKLLDEIGSLKKKLLENQAIVPDLNASTKEDPEEDEPPKEDPDNDDQVEEHTHDKDTATEDPVQENATENDVAMEDPKQRHATDHDPDENEEDQEHEGKDTATTKGTFEVQQDVQMQTPTIKDLEKQGKETANKIEKIEAFYKDFKGDSNLTIDIQRCLTCAQQNEDSLDCGIFVIQFATQMQEGKPIEATFEKEEVFAKRAQIATTLMNHENNYANGLKKILEDRRQQNKHGQYDDIPDEDFITLA
ncbi:hypothetical protein ACFX1S_023097 [Malus domestica]